MNQNALNCVGYGLLGLNHAEEAKEISILNVKAYPSFSNGYDYLG